jgi:hypothetical protein
VEVAGRVLLVTGAAIEAGAAGTEPGKVAEATQAGLVVATASVPVRLTGLRDLLGQPVCPSTIARTGDQLPVLDAAQAQALTDAMARVVAGETTWRRCLQSPQAIELRCCAKPPCRCLLA